MTSGDVAKPVLRAETPVAIVRQAREECVNAMDAARAEGITERGIALPTGEIATVRCARTARGETITIHVKAPRGPVAGR